MNLLTILDNDERNSDRIGVLDVGFIWRVLAASLSQHDRGLANGVYECKSCKGVIIRYPLTQLWVLLIKFMIRSRKEYTYIVLEVFNNFA